MLDTKELAIVYKANPDPDVWIGLSDLISRDQKGDVKKEFADLAERWGRYFKRNIAKTSIPTNTHRYREVFHLVVEPDSKKVSP